jgi:uncharacterized membrane protein (DUF485 family)
MNADWANDPSGWQRACAGTAFVTLKTERASLVKVLLVIYLVCYLGLAVLCGFARDLMGIRVLGPLNLGYTLILGNYLMAWVLGLIYLRQANGRLDSLAAAAIAEHTASRPGAGIAS